MNCCSCLQGLAKKEALEKEFESKSKELEAKLMELEAEKEKSDSLKKESLTAKQRTVDLQQKVDAENSFGFMACFAGIASICQPAGSMEEVQRLLEERQAELVKAKALLEMLKTKREIAEQEAAEAEAAAAAKEAEAKAQAEAEAPPKEEPEPKTVEATDAPDQTPETKASEAPEETVEPAAKDTEQAAVSANSKQFPRNLPFSSSTSFLRSQTPTEQQDLKSKIESLLADMKSIEEQQEAEKLLQEDLQQEQEQHDAAAAALEVKLIRRQHQGIKFDSLLRNQVKKSEPLSQKLFGSFTEKFRSETPANKRQMKVEVETFLAELEEVMADLDDEAQAQVKLYKAKARQNEKKLERTPSAIAYRQQRLDELSGSM